MNKTTANASAMNNLWEKYIEAVLIKTTRGVDFAEGGSDSEGPSHRVALKRDEGRRSHETFGFYTVLWLNVESVLRIAFLRT
jgi:hypothetical protein